MSAVSLPVPNDDYLVPFHTWRSLSAGRLGIEVVDTSSGYGRIRLPAAQSDASHSEDPVEILALLYTFRLSWQVRRFLHRHRALVPLLIEAYGKIAQYFGVNVSVILEVESDPSDESVGDRLFALVQIHGNREQARHQLKQLDQGWWLDTVPRARGLFNIALDYR